MPNSVPNYLTADANGNIGAQFPGGIKMLADTNLIHPENRKVLWVREGDGSYVAEVSTLGGSTQAATPFSGLTLNSGDSGNTQSRIDLAATVNGPRQSTIAITAHNSSDLQTAIDIRAGSPNYRLLGAADTSDFLRWTGGGNIFAGTRKAAIQCGAFFTAGPFSPGKTVTFTSCPAGHAILMNQASAYHVSGGTLYFDYSYNGVYIGSPSKYANAGSFHMEHVTWFLDLGYIGTQPFTSTVTVSLSNNPANGTLTDANDMWGCALIVL